MWQSLTFKSIQPYDNTCHDPPLTKLANHTLPHHHHLQPSSLPSKTLGIHGNHHFSAHNTSSTIDVNNRTSMRETNQNPRRSSHREPELVPPWTRLHLHRTCNGSTIVNHESHIKHPPLQQNPNGGKKNMI